MFSFLNTSGFVSESSSKEGDNFIVPPLDELIASIQDCPYNISYIKKYLTKDILSKYKNVQTSRGGSLALCIRTNSLNPGALMCRCADAECYDVFNDFFDPIIRDYHKVPHTMTHHPVSSFGNIENPDLEDLDPSGNHVISTRIRLARTIQGYVMSPLITKADRLELETKISHAACLMTNDLSGNYFSLSTMSRYAFDKLAIDHLIFRDDNNILRDAGGHRDWPSGRGIFLNHQRNFIVWINEEDHIKIISMEPGGNLARVYQRLVKGVEALSQKLSFVIHKKYGFLTFCPTDLGTSMRASAHVRIPMMSKLPNFKEICEKVGLDVRGTYGENTESIDGVYDLSNQRIFGLTEIEVAKEMAYGIKKVVSLEKEMEEYNNNLQKGLMAVEPLDYLVALLTNPQNKSLTRLYLAEEYIVKYNKLRTSKGSTLAHCIRNCAYNNKAYCPRVGDAECYELFSDYLNRIIMDYHGILDPDFKHPRVYFGDVFKLPFTNLDPTEEYVISTRIRVGRSVKGFNFPTTIDKAQRLRLESIIVETLLGLSGELRGHYYPLTGMDATTMRQLIDDHFLFKDDDPVLRDAGGYRDWPSGRGIFINGQKSFLVWICEEDHMRIISMQKGGNVADVYQRLFEGVRAIEEKLPFAHSQKLGFLTCCPSNLGTTMRASALLKIPKLSSDKIAFEEICQRLNLQARGLHGEHTDSPEGIYDISNKRRLGLTELEAVTEMCTGVKAIIDLEKFA